MIIRNWASLLCIGICFCFLTGAGFDSAPYMGVIRVPPGEKPNAYYRLLKKGESEPVKKLFRDMPVQNGDEIQPAAGKTVTLIYVNIACGKQELSRNTTVNCNPPPPASQNGIWIFSDFFERFKDWLIPKPLTEKAAPKFAEDETSCFPSSEFNLSPWPPDGATLLAGNRVIFRWFEAGESCSEAMLTIVSADGKAKPFPIRLGELKTVEMSLIPGRSYQWFIEDEEKEPLSDRYRFRVMSIQESNNIENQLAEIKKQYAEYAPELCQALYLQLISDAETNLDFYADSLRIIEPYSKKAIIPDALVEQLQRHCVSE
jgi:hypothetical protein